MKSKNINKCSRFFNFCHFYLPCGGGEVGVAGVGVESGAQEMNKNASSVHKMRIVVFFMGCLLFWVSVEDENSYRIVVALGLEVGSWSLLNLSGVLVFSAVSLQNVDV